MSIISAYEIDKSDYLYKRFASLASVFLERPKEVKATDAEVPLENIFRLLEMYRYSAFSDECRSGILSNEQISDHIDVAKQDENWSMNIEQAVNNAISNVYGQTSKDEAIDDLEETIRRLMNKDDIDQNSLTNAKSFFIKFSQELD